MLPLLRALATAGHQVLVAVPARMAEIATTLGLPVATMPDSIDLQRSDIADRMKEVIGDGDPTNIDTSAAIRLLAAGPHVPVMYEALLTVAREFEPSLILRDGTEFAAVLVAEKIGVPQLPVPSGAANLINADDMLASLNELRTTVGLPTGDDPAALHPYGRIDCVPPTYSFSHFPAPAIRAYQQASDVTAPERLPNWITELPSDRPLVVAALGTASAIMRAEIKRTGAEPPPFMPDLNERMTTLHEALSQLDAVAILTTGDEWQPENPAENVRVVRSIPQPQLLRCTDLFITHGGYNSIREAISAGVPMAVLPNFGDQPINADRVAELGLGLRITDETPAGIAEVCRRVQSDHTITARVRHAQRAMLALPPIEAAVADLESIVTESAGVPAVAG